MNLQQNPIKINGTGQLHITGKGGGENKRRKRLSICNDVNTGRKHSAGIILTRHRFDVDSATMCSVFQNQLLQVEKCLLVITLTGENKRSEHSK